MSDSITENKEIKEIDTEVTKEIPQQDPQGLLDRPLTQSREQGSQRFDEKEARKVIFNRESSGKYEFVTSRRVAFRDGDDVIYYNMKKGVDGDVFVKGRRPRPEKKIDVQNHEEKKQVKKIFNREPERFRASEKPRRISSEAGEPRRISSEAGEPQTSITPKQKTIKELDSEIEPPVQKKIEMRESRILTEDEKAARFMALLISEAKKSWGSD